MSIYNFFRQLKYTTKLYVCQGSTTAIFVEQIIKSHNLNYRYLICIAIAESSAHKACCSIYHVAMCGISTCPIALRVYAYAQLHSCRILIHYFDDCRQSISSCKAHKLNYDKSLSCHRTAIDIVGIVLAYWIVVSGG